MSGRPVLVTRALRRGEMLEMEQRGLSPAEARGALFALRMVKELAKVAKPQFPALANSRNVTIPLQKALEEQANMAIALASCAEITIPLATTHGAPATNGA